MKELTRPQPRTSTRAPTCGVPAASGEGRVKPLEFLHAEVGGGQVRAGLVRFLSPCTLGGWARSLTSLGRLGLALWNHQEPQAICPGLCVPCQLNQAVFQCQPHLCSRISPQLREFPRQGQGPSLSSSGSTTETRRHRHRCQHCASVCERKFLNVFHSLAGVVLIPALPG